MDWSFLGSDNAPASSSTAPAASTGKTGFGDLLSDTLSRGISRVVDAEIDKQYKIGKKDPLFANENGEGGTAGQPVGTLTAPTVTVLGMQTSPLMLAAGAAAALLIVVMLMRR